MSASTEQLAQMRAVNTEVDAQPYDAIPSRDEGGDVWKDRPDGGTWVCRDYALLKAETDLLWFGGIGTYIKAASQPNLEVGDRANDAVRINGGEVRAKVKAVPDWA